MPHSKKALWLLGAAVIALSPALATAKTHHQKQPSLEARLNNLESHVNSLEGDLATTKAELAKAKAEAEQAKMEQARLSQEVAARDAALSETTKKANDIITLQPRVEALEKRPVAADGMKSGDTTIKFGGFIKANAIYSQYDSGEVAVGGLGRDFYLPANIPVGGTTDSTNFDMIGKQTRLWMNLETPVAGKALKGYVEYDFQTTQGAGSQRTTNGFNLALRRAFITYDKFAFGQDWTNFQYVAALPESTDFVGTTEGTVFVRQPQVRYTTKLGAHTTFSVSAENPETSSLTPSSATLIENDDDHIPDVTARLIYAGSFGELSLAGVGRQLSVVNGAIGDQKSGWGLSGAGKVWLGAAHKNDLRFMVTTGDGIGRYVGLNYAPDVVYAGGVNDRLQTVKVTAGFAAVRLVWTPTLRTTIMASTFNADYPVGSPAGANKSAQSAAINIFWTPVKGLDLGAEYRKGKRELLSGAKGNLERIELIAKYGF